MTIDEFIKLLKAENNNALRVLSYRVVYVPDDNEPINIVATVEHIESALQYTQILRLSHLDAQYLGNQLLVQGKAADDQRGASF